MRTALLGCLLTAALAAATVVSAATAPAEAATTVRLTLAVRGCDGCLARPVQAANHPDIYWHGRTKTVQDGTVSWTLPTRRTRGMSFEITDRQAVGMGAVPNVVIAYRGLAVGAHVSAPTAAHKKRATGCWVGTERAAVTLRVRVDRFADTYPSGSGHVGYNIRPYLTSTARHLAPAGITGAYGPTYRGTIGNQDAYYCTQ